MLGLNVPTLLSSLIILALIVDFCVGCYRYNLPPAMRGLAPPQESWQDVYKTWVLTAVGGIIGFVLAAVIGNINSVSSDAVLVIILIGVIFRTATAWRS